VDINYGEELIVVVKFNAEWTYYVSDKELWILDQKAWAQSFKDAGYDVPNDDFSDRFDIAVVDQETVPRFLREMAKYQRTLEQLRNLVATRAKGRHWDEVSIYFPALFIDFDSRRLISYFPEPFPFEKYIPPNWESLYAPFFEEIPADHRYWIIEEEDCLQEAMRLDTKRIS
jgi:hypothetical protein